MTKIFVVTRIDGAEFDPAWQNVTGLAYTDENKAKAVCDHLRDEQRAKVLEDTKRLDLSEAALADRLEEVEFRVETLTLI